MSRLTNEKQNIEITEIKTDLKWVKAEISDIKENHLGCIRRKIEDIYSKLEANKIWLIGILVSVIITLISILLKK